MMTLLRIRLSPFVRGVLWLAPGSRSGICAPYRHLDGWRWDFGRWALDWTNAAKNERELALALALQYPEPARSVILAKLGADHMPAAHSREPSTDV